MNPPGYARWLMPCLFGLWAALLTLTLFTASKLYSAPLILGSLFPLVLVFSRNPRAILLFCMVFTAGLGLSINFATRVHIGGAPSFSVDLMDFFLLALAAMLLRDYVRGYRKEFRWSSISAWWLALVALGLLDLVRGPLRELHAFEVLRMLKCWVLFLIIVNECVREKHFERVIWALAAGVALNVLIAFLQFALRRDLGLQALGEPAADATLGANYGVYLSAGSAYRVGALMGHPNLLAAYLALLLPVFIGQLFAKYQGGTKLLFGVLAGLGCGALVLTLSRSGRASFALAMMGLMAVVFIHPALRFRKTNLKLAMVTIGVLVALLAADTVIRRFTMSDPGATDFRGEWVGIAWDMVKQKPLTGFGLNTFSYEFAPFSKDSVATLYKKFGAVWPVVHNIYMLTWAEQGTLGLMLFLGMHVNILIISIRNASKMYNERLFMLSVGCACGVLAVMLDGFSSFFMRVPASGRIFWIVMGLIVACQHWNQRNAYLRQAFVPVGK